MRRTQPHRRVTVRNGQVARRRVVTTGRRRERDDARVGQADPAGSRVLLWLVGAAVVISAGFILAVRFEKNVIDLGGEESRVRDLLRDAARQQRVEVLRQEEAIGDAQRSALVQSSGSERRVLTEIPASMVDVASDDTPKARPAEAKTPRVVPAAAGARRRAPVVRRRTSGEATGKPRLKPVTRARRVVGRRQER